MAEITKIAHREVYSFHKDLAVAYDDDEGYRILASPGFDTADLKEMSRLTRDELRSLLAKVDFLNAFIFTLEDHLYAERKAAAEREKAMRAAAEQKLAAGDRVRIRNGSSGSFGVIEEIVTFGGSWVYVVRPEWDLTITNRYSACDLEKDTPATQKTEEK